MERLDSDVGIVKGLHTEPQRVVKVGPGLLAANSDGAPGTC